MNIRILASSLLSAIMIGASLYGAPIEDTKAPLLLPKSSWELSYHYGIMNDTIDILNIREKELSNSYAKNSTSIGDMTSHTLGVNYTAFQQTMIHLSIATETIGYGSSDLDVMKYEAYWRYVWSPTERMAVGFDAGVRGNWAKQISLSTANEIQYYINVTGKNIQASETSEYLWLTKTTTDTSLSLGFPKSEHPDVSIDDLSDRSLFLRTSIAYPYTAWTPSVFAEYGQTSIQGAIDTNLDDIAGVNFQDLFDSYTIFPIKLDRNERYMTVGFNLRMDGPFETTLDASYAYTKLFRDESINTIDYNHKLTLGCSIPYDEELVFTLSGTYLDRQFNGEIPFLYNNYSKNSFDHPYGWVKLGVNYTVK
ncbi:MAG: hypothetical protein IE883_07685 [Epsilonproteobacteria bacterium]|nr:hypothetical protein [Campylobacterota bacterium]